jgi:hypothetical protein
MIIKAWIQMGNERRQTTIEIPDDEFKAGIRWASEDSIRSPEAWLEEYVLDWLTVQYGWGWSGAGHENDFSLMEGQPDGGFGALHVTADSSIPNTRSSRVCPRCRQPESQEFSA